MKGIAPGWHRAARATKRQENGMLDVGLQIRIPEFALADAFLHG
jgi:hypothetical protein